MESKQSTNFIRQTFLCLLLLLQFHSLFAYTDPEIISTQDEIITYINHTAKLSCIIQHRNRQHVTWARVNFINDIQKLTSLLYVDLLKYTQINRYHLTHLVEKDNREYWNLEIRQVHLADQGYYSCALAAVKPISKIFYLKVIDNTRNPPMALRSTVNMQHLGTEQSRSSSSSSSPSLLRVLRSNILLMIILGLILIN